jgi:hypothetical protein
MQKLARNADPTARALFKGPGFFCVCIADADARRSSRTALLHCHPLPWMSGEENGSDMSALAGQSNGDDGLQQFD